MTVDNIHSHVRCQGQALGQVNGSAAIQEHDMREHLGEAACTRER